VHETGLSGQDEGHSNLKDLRTELECGGGRKQRAELKYHTFKGTDGGEKGRNVEEGGKKVI
jgi:hypothetical protein